MQLKIFSLPIRLFIIGTLAIILSGCSNHKSDSQQGRGLAQRASSPPKVSPNATLRSYYNFSPAQSSAIESLLKDHPGWRIARASDCSSIFLADIRKQDSTYEPYFREDDFNNDGNTDFAIAMKHDSTFTLFWFEGIDSTYSIPEMLTSANWYDECGFSNSRQAGYLKFGHFFSDVGAYFHWNPQIHKFEYSNSVKDENTNPGEEDLESY